MRLDRYKARRKLLLMVAEWSKPLVGLVQAQLAKQPHVYEIEDERPSFSTSRHD